MAILNQTITQDYALYNGDCCEVLPKLPKESVDFCVYSPPFGGLYHYSSSPRDISNCADYEAFLAHYEFVVAEVARVLKPGCFTMIHVMDAPLNSGGLVDMQGDVIRMHQRHGLEFYDRKLVWKDPLKEAYRTRALALRHNQLLKDSTPCKSALPDYVIVMQKKGTRAPVAHPVGLRNYAGELDPDRRAQMGYTAIPDDLIDRGNNWTGDPNSNPLSHWIFRRYASPVWNDVRQSRVLPFEKARESEEEKHVHPLQRDVIERSLILWSNPGDVVLSPFAGVGSEVYGAVELGRRGIGIELKASYYRQSVVNLSNVYAGTEHNTLDFGSDLDGGLPQSIGMMDV